MNFSICKIKNPWLRRSVAVAAFIPFTVLYAGGNAAWYFFAGIAEMGSAFYYAWHGGKR